MQNSKRWNNVLKFLLVIVVVLNISSCSSNNAPEAISDPGPSLIKDGNWEFVSNNTPNLAVTVSLKANGNDIYAATQSWGIFKSTDNGNSWAATAASFPFDHISSPGTTIEGMEIINNTIVVNITDGDSLNIYASTDLGQTWQVRTNGLTISRFTLLTENASRLYLVADVTKGYYSDDAAVTWDEINTKGIPSKYFYQIISLNSKYFVVSDSGIYVSANNGNSWSPVNTVLGQNARLFPIFVTGNNILIGYKFGVLISNDGGKVWSISSNWSLYEYPCERIIEKNNIVFTGHIQGIVYFSTDFGTTWKQLGNTITPINNSIGYLLSLEATDKYIFASTKSGGVFRYRLY